MCIHPLDLNDDTEQVRVPNSAIHSHALSYVTRLDFPVQKYLAKGRSWFLVLLCLRIFTIHVLDRALGRD